MTEFEMDPMAYNDMSMCGITATQLSEYDGRRTKGEETPALLGE